ncbi:SDR family oxidoreductase [Oceanobacillus alkalisoli]|uniref:SDR family oxidoreductase n=1 Tax=Oceanobacillus alkalisoli TaxID=2925113 RepID=UPI001EF11221|nr:SDR family oxidoreductase [Oceanobacillus alkalisoli]MCF3944197.1 SDR family oxidoreductase [Oceanobacillus alkalisoli]MCG5103193.1 SDR family oxidoreductase [Oceanobacillus alkalisoli]
MNKLQGETAIVTGASAGIGAAIAKELASKGANIVLAARRMDKLNEVKNEITEITNGKVKVIAVQADVSAKNDVNQLVEQAQTELGNVDILVNNAGQMLTATVQSGKVEEWEKMIDVNVKGTLYSIDAVLPSMVSRSAGHIINIASVSGLEVTKTNTVYSATKHAVRVISQGLEKELARTGVRITNISPGMVDTNLSSDNSWNGRKKLEPTDIAKAVVYAVTQPNYVNVNEITVRPV